MIRDRRGTVIGVSAAAVCLAGLLAATAGGPPDDDGYVAVGAAGSAPERPDGKAVAPTGDVELVPLDPADGNDGGKRRESAGASPAPETGAPGSTEPAPDGRTPGNSPGEEDSSGPSGGTQDSPPGAEPSAPGSSSPAGPAVLKVGEPVRKALEDRWCEKVTLEFRNTGGTAVRSGTVTFGTHIIGALGVDWATVESQRKLPVPIGAGETEKKSWNVCVDAWRVPLGMHIETQDVSVKWK